MHNNLIVSELDMNVKLMLCIYETILVVEEHSAY